MTDWIDACGLDDIEEEGVRRFDHAGRSYAIYRMAGEEVFCSDGLCTHEAVHRKRFLGRTFPVFA